MPTPRSARRGTPEVAQPVRSDPRTATSTRSVRGFGQNFAGGKVYLHPGDGRSHHAGRDSRQVPFAGRARRWRPGLPHHRRGRRQGAWQPEHHVQRGRQPGDLLHARHRCARGPRRDQRGVGQARRIGGRPRRSDRRRGVSRRRHVSRPSPAASCRGTRRPRRSRRHRPSSPTSSPAWPFRATRPPPSTPPAGPRAVHSGPWVPPRDRRARSARMAWCRPSRAARSSTARPPGPT